SQPIQVLRARKMPQELNYIHMAAEVASDALYEAVPLLQPGVRECDVARALAGVIYSSEAEFSHIVVASGERSVIPHGLPTSRRFQAMDLVVIDFGVLYKGYWAEICRTFAIKRATKRQKEIFGLVKEGQERAVRALKPGVKAYLVDQAVREYFVQAGFGECFIHSTGHGLGLGDQGDPPFIAPGSEHVVPECGAISLEPGLYLKSEGIGIRLEDAFLIHGERVQRVTSVPQELCIT
ncbi:MAG: M24 family metallopeptidase, partial [Candidatus Hadarchaeum sp.]|uniref:M24 family metallopeptidase n=1 Tax=Candidatus Hadarchaeum sp. TaxID=2883567 RepID=UPI003172FBB0